MDIGNPDVPPTDTGPATKDRKGARTRPGLTDVVIGSIKSIGEHLAGLGDAFEAMRDGRPPTIDVLTYEKAVEFFVKHKDDVPGAESGALTRRSAGREYQAYLVFLSADGEPIVGDRTDPAPARTYLVRSFDAELTELFGDSDVIIFN